MFVEIPISILELSHNVNKFNMLLIEMWSCIQRTAPTDAVSWEMLDIAHVGRAAGGLMWLMGGLQIKILSFQTLPT